MLTGFHHVSLSVRDLDASAEWYESVFDLDVVVEEGNDDRRGRVYRLRGTDVMLSLVEHDANPGDPFTPVMTGLDHAAFSVAGRADVDAWGAHLDECAVEHSGPIDVPIGTILNFHDPDGVQLSVFWEGTP